MQGFYRNVGERIGNIKQMLNEFESTESPATQSNAKTNRRNKSPGTKK